MLFRSVTLLPLVAIMYTPDVLLSPDLSRLLVLMQIGRASCRERVKISVVDVSLKKKKEKKKRKKFKFVTKK